MKYLSKALFSFAIPVIIAAFLSVSSANAAYITQTVTHNVNDLGSDFVFNEFNSPGNTLTGITLTVGGVDTGSFTITNTAKTTVITLATDYLTFTYGSETIADVSMNSINLVTTPTSPNTGAIIASGTHSYTLKGTGNDLGTYTDNFSDSGRFASYVGLGTIYFTASNSPGIGLKGGDYAAHMSTTLANTTMTLTYLYELTPVPEAGQVAASALLLLGVGGVCVHRRKAAKSALQSS